MRATDSEIADQQAADAFAQQHIAEAARAAEAAEQAHHQVEELRGQQR